MQQLTVLSIRILLLAFVTIQCESWNNARLHHSNAYINRRSNGFPKNSYYSGVQNVVFSRRISSTTNLFAEKEKLVFTANFDIVSDILDNNRDDVYAYCRSTNCRNHFVSAGGKLNMKELQWNNILEEIWSETSESIYGIENAPNKSNGDVMLATESKIQFPGVQLINTVFMGIKLLKDTTGAPNYKFIMIADNKNVSGAPPVVWLFNKLTGTDTQGEYNPPTGKVETSVTVVPVDNDGGYALRFLCNVEIVTEFSKSLLKILPASKEKIQEQGSVSVSKTIEKDVRSSLESVVNAYKEWKVTSLVAQEV